jgi:hypothetical protein
VLAGELERLAAALALTGAGLDDIGEFAGTTFEYDAALPNLARLLQWEGLQGGPPANWAKRSAHCREKVTRFTEAQNAGVLAPGLEPAHTVFALIALAA